MGIYCNQVGYYPAARKTAVLTEGTQFKVVKQGDEPVVVMNGKATAFGTDKASGDTVCIADFSQIQESGTYYIENENGIKSHSFVIGDAVYEKLQTDLLKAFYFQRCGCALEEKYAGVYKHDCCHTKEAMVYENQSIIKDVSGGWHDAGDYGRYISPAAVAVGHLLYAYRLFPEAFRTTLNIPESGNGIPDILNECRYELEWMLKMQDEEGGAYHKLTSFVHAEFIMPEDDKAPFYLFPVSSMATADYAAVMRMAAKVYRDVDEEFATRLEESAGAAYAWLEKHPEYIGFHNPQGSNTGEYDDICDLDERLWAASEMLVATGEDKYRDTIKKLLKEKLGCTDFGWTDVSGFASLAILTDENHRADEDIYTLVKEKVMTEADRLLDVAKHSGYGVAMEPEDYVWGSNMVVLNRGMLFVLAAMVAEQDADLREKVICYEEAALAQIHYLLGKNAVDYSYVTGHGENAYRHPHNRPTEADGIELPMPGWVSGGPFKTPCDEVGKQRIKPGTPPMKCYVDHWSCYSLNEITIYWNSPAVFVLAYFKK